MSFNVPCEVCGSRAAHCRHYPALVSGFRGRVRLAIRCIETGEGLGSRAFDTCFEMSDGSAVVSSIVRRAAVDPIFKEQVLRAGGASWIAAGDLHPGEPDLERVAKRLRKEVAAGRVGQLALF